MSTLSFTILGRSITSSHGTGQAPTWRGLVRALTEAGHGVTFLERADAVRDADRDLAAPRHGDFAFYASAAELRDVHAARIRESDVVIVASQLEENDAIARLVLDTARGRKLFYDFAAPVTAEKLASGAVACIGRDLVPRFDLYLATSGGPALWRIGRMLGARRAEALYATVDPEICRPSDARTTFDLGYLGHFDAERRDVLEALFFEPARQVPDARLILAGSGYPEDVAWPANVLHVDHVNPSDHASFFNAQDLTLNLTTPVLRRAGYSPGTRLFEAAACGSAILGDAWPGIEEFLTPNREILIALSTDDVVAYLEGCGEQLCADIGAAARKRFLAEHAPRHRAARLLRLLADRPARTPAAG